MALLNLVYRDQLCPRDACRQTFDRLLERLSEKSACRLMVNLLALAHEQGCEAALLAAGPNLVIRPRLCEAAIENMDPDRTALFQAVGVRHVAGRIDTIRAEARETEPA
jgi:hypothetical protein